MLKHSTRITPLDLYQIKQALRDQRLTFLSSDTSAPVTPGEAAVALNDTVDGIFPEPFVILKFRTDTDTIIGGGRLIHILIESIFGNIPVGYDLASDRFLPGLQDFPTSATLSTVNFAKATRNASYNPDQMDQIDQVCTVLRNTKFDFRHYQTNDPVKAERYAAVLARTN